MNTLKQQEQISYPHLCSDLKREILVLQQVLKAQIDKVTPWEILFLNRNNYPTKQDYTKHVPSIPMAIGREFGTNHQLFNATQQQKTIYKEDNNATNSLNQQDFIQ